MEDFERCLLVKNEVFVYKIPPRTSAKGFRAADWNLSTPDWTGRLRVMEKSRQVKLKLEDRGSNELFAACPVEAYPGPAIESVTDSSRYFVIKIVDEGGRSAFIGIGFSDRSDSFDLNVALQDHFKGVTKEAEIAKEDQAPAKPQLDLAFKEGQTIKVNINIPKSDKVKTRAPGRGGGALPPPPGVAGSILPPPPGVAAVKPPSQNNNQYKAPGTASLTPLTSPSSPLQPSTTSDLLGLDLSPLSIQPSTAPPLLPSAPATKSDDPWGAFESAGESDGAVSKEWVGF